MASKMVDGRLRSAGNVTTNAETTLPLIRRSSDTVLGEGGGDKVAEVIGMAVGTMNRASARVQEADSKLKLDREESLEATARRDEAAEKCRGKLLPLRGVVSGLFGDSYARKLGFVGPTPDEPTSVYRLCSEIVGKAGAIEVPTLSIGEANVDPVALVQPLIAPTEELRLAIAASTKEQRESDLAQIEKNEAIAAYDRAFSLAANLLSTFLEVAGERELARRVRPSIRRPGNTVEVAGGASDPEMPVDEPSAEQPVAATTETTGTRG